MTGRPITAMVVGDRPKAVAKLVCGIEVFDALTHAYCALAGTRLQVLGREGPPWWHTASAVANAIVALRLGMYAWRQPRRAGKRREAQTHTRESFVGLLLDIRNAKKQGPAAIGDRRRTRLAELVTFARNRSPYYRELYRSRPDRVEDPTLLPVTSKQALMANFDAAVTDREVTLQKVRAFIADPDLIGEPFLGVRVFSVFTPLPDLVAQLNDFRPALLFGYATAIAALAAEQEAGRLRIDPVLVVPTAERLPPGEHEKIAEVFSARVGEVYGSTEIGVATFRCAHGWLHVNSDWVILEPVERDFSPTPPGRPSHTVLVTNLANRVQPIIRYDLGDSLTTRPDPCPCGTPLPAIRVEGRRDDALRFPGAGGREARVLPLALGTAIEETPGVLQFQAYQSQDDELTIRLAAEPDAEPEAVWRDVGGHVTEFLAAQGGDVRLRRASEPPHRDPRTQKFRSIWDARARQASEGRER